MKLDAWQIVPAIFLGLISLLPNYCFAQSPQPCIGYNPETKKWGEIGVNGFKIHGGNCPKGYAFISQSRVGNPDRKGSQVPVTGDCCKLPDDALVDFHELVSADCSPGFVATGAKQTLSRKTYKECKKNKDLSCKEMFSYQTQLMRCTQVNTDRYQLGSQKSAVYWGWPRHLSDLWQERISRKDIPVSIRYAVGRKNKYNWSYDGCIGKPIGSLFTKKTGRRCHQLYTRELQYRGIKGDPPQGTAVEIFPRCYTIDNRFSKLPTCIN